MTSVSTSSWRLKRTVQCKACPWLKSTRPHEIQNGYSEDKHRALARTIAEPGDISTIFREQRVMSCHEIHDAHCLGWLVNQVGPGNNIGMRIRMMACENAKSIRLRGEQHETFEETLP